MLTEGAAMQSIAEEGVFFKSPKTPLRLACPPGARMHFQHPVGRRLLLRNHFPQQCYRILGADRFLKEALLEVFKLLGSFLYL